MNKFLQKIIGDIGDKKEWIAMEKRAKALPRDYQVAYGEIKKYMWASLGLETTDVFKGLLELFEEGVANGTQVLEIIGDDVASFCDELVRGEKTYFEKLRKKLNRNIAEKIGK